MSIAASRCLYAPHRIAQRVSHRFLTRPRFLHSSNLDSPPHSSRQIAFERKAVRYKPYYVTTPIFYPNSVPHIGHLYSLVIADIFARNARLSIPTSKRPVRFITGTDEHGLKIQKAAKENGMEPQEFCDHLCTSFASLADRADISYTKFVRTSSEEHCLGVQTLWRNLQNSGLIYLGEHSGWYCVSDECFYTESQIRGDVDLKTGGEVKVSVETGKVVEWTKEQNWKFALSKFKIPLREHFRANPDAIFPSSQRKDVMDILESDDPKSLLDLSISRPSWRLKWGIPVPGDPSQTIYVWLDALASYLTGIGYPWPDRPTMLKNGWPVNLQIIGKDILKFHAIYFPAFLTALSLPLPRALLSHAHWTVNKAKMSKSVGNVVDPIAVLKEHGPDTVRWYLARTGGYFKSDVDWNDDQLKKSAFELQSLLGNVLLRLQSPKILQRLPPAFQEIPLHRGILMTRTNGPELLPEPGSDFYNDARESRRYRYAAIHRPFQDDWARSVVLPEPSFSTEREPMVQWYSELPRPDATDESPIVSPELRDAVDTLRGEVFSYLQRFEVGEATQSIVDVLSLLNKEITRIAPWSTGTSSRDTIHLLTWAREALRICGILLHPFIPRASKSLLDALRVHPRCRTYAYACIGAGTVRAGPLKKTILFPDKAQRAWLEVEADHNRDENYLKKEQFEQVRADKSLRGRHKRVLKARPNRLYQRLFYRYGPKELPNLNAPFFRRMRKYRERLNQSNHRNSTNATLAPRAI